MRWPTIILPVYDAFQEALTCIRSVLEHTGDPYRLVVIDDCSPDGRLVDFLPEEVLRDRHLRVTRNQRNLGFVRTCNLGMRRAQPWDVVLLNSDTQVTPGWLDKLRQAAYSGPRIATATPLTNNGEICSIPQFLRDNDLPPDYRVNEFAQLVERVSAREYREVPTCVGFCVYIKREVIERVGLFDEEGFGRGYGEENDFSCRARAAGYVDVVDDATFVFHKGRRSFQHRGATLTAEHLKILAKKHPDYFYRVRKFIAENPLREVHRRIQDAMLQRWMEKAEYVILHVLHNPPLTPLASKPQLPGGTEYHVADLIRTISVAAHWSLFSANEAYCLTAHVPGMPERQYWFSRMGFDLGALIDPGFFDLIHVHHIQGFPYDGLAEALLRHGRYVVSLHDFRLCCPRVRLLTRNHELCNGHECVASCRQKQESVDLLRSTSARLLRSARAVIHFSQSTKDRFLEILGGDYPWIMIEHGVHAPSGRKSFFQNLSPLPPLSASGVEGEGLQTCCSPSGGACVPLSASGVEGEGLGISDDVQGGPAPAFPRPSATRPLKVAFVGTVGVHKGADLIRQIVRRQSLPSGLPVEWHLIGLNSEGIKRGAIQHGTYARDELATILENVSPDLAAILSIWPETYSYAFEELLMSGVPVISTPLGAPAERMRRYRCGWVLDRLDVEAFFEKLEQIVHSWEDYCAVRRRIAAIKLQSAEEAAERYQQVYRGACPIGKPVDAARLLQTLGELTAAFPYHASWPRSLAGRAFSAVESLLETLGIRPSVEAVLRRFLPYQVQCSLRDLRPWRRPADGPAPKKTCEKARAA
jgi:GT2 family glycosyltransferase